MVIFMGSIDFILLKQKINLHLMKKYVKIKDFRGIVMPSKYDNILGFNQYVKPDRMPHIIYTDIESLVKKIDGCANNPEYYTITKRCEHILCRYSMSTFDYTENKHTLYNGKNCLKKFSKSLREHVKI